jgi:hypothetical protein
MSDTTIDRVLINGLLVKLGFEDPVKLTNERAMAKVESRVRGKGVPEDLTPEEYQYIKSAGLVPGTPATTETKPSTETTPDPDMKVPHRLKGIGLKPNRVELITPAKAEKRNADRNDDRRWELAPDIDASTVPPDGLNEPQAGEPAVKPDKKATKTPAKATPTAKTEKPAKEKKEPKPKKESSRPSFHGLSMCELIRALAHSYSRAQVSFLVQKAGFTASPHTVYVQYAEGLKNPKPELLPEEKKGIASLPAPPKDEPKPAKAEKPAKTPAKAAPKKEEKTPAKKATKPAPAKKK